MGLLAWILAGLASNSGFRYRTMTSADSALEPQAPQRLPGWQGVHLHPAPTWGRRLQPAGERIGTVEPSAHGA